MRKILLAALATAAFLSGGMHSNRADAITLAARSVLGVANTRLIQKAAVVCGYYGCVRTHPHYYGGAYYGRPYAYYGRPYGYYARRW
jgi:hypothetical protein